MGCCDSKNDHATAATATIDQKNPSPIILSAIHNEDKPEAEAEPVAVAEVDAPQVIEVETPVLNPDEPEIKCVLVGDTYVGKSALITNYLRNEYSDAYEPTVLDVYKGEKKIKKKKYFIEIHDTTGDDNMGASRSL